MCVDIVLTCVEFACTLDLCLIHFGRVRYEVYKRGGCRVHTLPGDRSLHYLNDAYPIHVSFDFVLFGKSRAWFLLLSFQKLRGLQWLTT